MSNRIEDDNYKQLHVNIQMDLYKDFVNLLPERGMVSIVVRRLIMSYIKAAKDGVVNEDGIGEIVRDVTK